MRFKFVIIFFILLIALFEQGVAQVPVNGYAQITGISGNTLSVSNVDETYDTFEDGEKIIIMQMQDSVIGDTSNTMAFGNIGAIKSAGLYEYATILSHTEVGLVVTSITISGSFTNVYYVGANSRLQLISYPVLGSPNYTTTSAVTGLAWNGNTGGVIAFEVNGTINLNNNINADGIGFRGGQKSVDYFSGAYICQEFVFKDIPLYHGGKGEGIYKNNFPHWNNARGKILNGGGGGNHFNAGGGGGGGYSKGGEGGPGYGCTNAPSGVGGKGGIALSSYYNINAIRLYMGGGGGGGQQNQSAGTKGENGGGIIIIKANKIKTPLVCSGILITANGNSNNIVSPGDGEGGGGAGGAILINCPVFDIVNSGCLVVSANGGKGGDCTYSSTVGGGGGGGQGSIIYTTCTPAIVYNNSFTKNGKGGANDVANASYAENGAGADNQGVFYNPRPIALFSNSTICNGNATQFTDGSTTPSGSITTWVWNFGDGSLINTSQNPSHLYANAGNYNVTLMTSNTFGCNDTITKSVQVYYNPIAGFTHIDVCLGDTMHFTNTSSVDPSTSIANYLWTFGDGSMPGSLMTPSHYYSNPGTYSVQLLTTTVDVCSNTAILNVSVHPSPTAVANSNSPVMVGGSINLSTDTVSGIVWTGPNGFTSILQNPILANAQLSNSGNYQVVKTNSFGCKDTANTFVTVYQPEIPGNGIDDDGDGLIDCADPDLATLSQCYVCGYDSIAWKTVVPEPGFNKGIAVKYTGFDQHFIVPAGVTSIKIKTWGAGGGGGYFTLYGFAAGAGGFTVDQLVTLPGETYIVVAGEGGYATRSVNQTARATFGFGGSGNSMGAPSISETGSGGGLSGVFFNTVTQANARVIAGGGGGMADAGGLDETSGGNGNNPLAGGYLPLTGQSAVSNSTGFGGGGGGYVGGISGIHRFSYAGHLPDTFADAGEGGSGYKYTSGGLIKFTPELNIYPPEMTDVHYIAGSGVGNDYNMAVGAVGDIKTGGNGLVVIQWFEPANDLTISASKDSICKGDTLTLTASGHSNYLWSPSATLANDTAKIVIAAPSADITYRVISNYLNCKDTAQIKIVVHPLPHLTLSPDSSVCLGNSLQLNVGGANSYSWVPATGLSAISGTTVFATPLVSIQYFVTGTDNNNCSATDSLKIRVDSLPTAAITGNPGVCIGGSTILTASGGNTYLWNTGQTSAGITISPSLSTPYSVVVKNSNDCIDTAMLTIVVHALPTPQFYVANVCQGSIMSFNGSLSSVPSPDSLQSWVWNFGDGSSVSNNQTTTHLYAATGSYEAQLLTVSGFGCRDSLLKTSIVKPNPVVKFTANDSVGCAPHCFSLTDLSTISIGYSNAHWAWDFGDGSPIGTSKDFEHCYTNISVDSTACFTVSLTVTSDSGCVSTGSKNNFIKVYPNPKADFSVQPGSASLTNPVISITDLSAGASLWKWNFGDFDTSSIYDPLPHRYADTGVYTITLVTSTQYGCRDTAYQTVTIEPDFVFYIPNAFSPDGDGINDTFSGKGIFISHYEMSIFDRWGNLIFFSNDINVPWDGKANHGAEIALRDVYVYSIQVTDFKKRKHNYKGMVTLLR